MGTGLWRGFLGSQVLFSNVTFASETGRAGELAGMVRNGFYMYSQPILTFLFQRMSRLKPVLVRGLTSRPQAPRPRVNASSGDPRLVFNAGCAVLAIPGHYYFSPFGLVVTMMFFFPNCNCASLLMSTEAHCASVVAL